MNSRYRNRAQWRTGSDKRWRTGQFLVRRRESGTELWQISIDFLLCAGACSLYGAVVDVYWTFVHLLCFSLTVNVSRALNGCWMAAAAWRNPVHLIPVTKMQNAAPWDQENSSESLSHFLSTEWFQHLWRNGEHLSFCTPGAPVLRVMLVTVKCVMGTSSSAWMNWTQILVDSLLVSWATPSLSLVLWYSPIFVCQDLWRSRILTVKLIKYLCDPWVAEWDRARIAVSDLN